MSAYYRSKIIKSAEDTASVLVDSSVWGADLAGALSKFQLSVTGLEGGTWSVGAVLVGDEDDVNLGKSLATGRTEAQIVTVEYLVAALRFDFAGMGSGNAPRVNVTGILRGL